MIVQNSRWHNEVNQRLDASQAAFGDLRNHMDKQLKVVNNNLRCFAGTIQGSFVHQRTQGMVGSQALRLMPMGQGRDNYNLLEEGVKPAELCNNPKSLEMLWQEYKLGLNGLKPSEQFTMSERNVNKAKAQKYSRRYNIWHCIQRLVNSGYSAEVAIQKIYRVYGFTLSPTKIINQMIADKKKYHDQGGFHPQLQ
ncbi:hypothetical protein ACHAWF_008421 [Thalassiosira exigua]